MPHSDISSLSFVLSFGVCRAGGRVREQALALVIFLPALKKSPATHHLLPRLATALHPDLLDQKVEHQEADAGTDHHPKDQVAVLKGRLLLRVELSGQLVLDRCQLFTVVLRLCH